MVKIWENITKLAAASVFKWLSYCEVEEQNLSWPRARCWYPLANLTIFVPNCGKIKPRLCFHHPKLVLVCSIAWELSPIQEYFCYQVTVFKKIPFNWCEFHERRVTSRKVSNRNLPKNTLLQVQIVLFLYIQIDIRCFLKFKFYFGDQTCR